jgi:hypothetical protein
MWIFIAIVLAGVFLLTQTEALPALVDVVERGRRLSVDVETASGIVTSVDSVLLAQAAAIVGRPVAPEAYALARVCRSDEGRAGQIAKTYLCHVLMNQADSLGWGIVRTVQFHTTAARDEHYGAQISGRVASGEDPYESDLAAAEYAVAQRAQGLDPTAGATNFVDKRAFGVQEGTGSFEDLVAVWGSEGKSPGNLPGAPASLVFFWRGHVPDVATEVTA